jgi:hypothetical protein
MRILALMPATHNIVPMARHFIKQSLMQHCPVIYAYVIARNKLYIISKFQEDLIWWGKD